MFLLFLTSIIGLISLFFLFINLPFSQGFISKQANQALSHSGLPIQIQTIQTILPTKVKVLGVSISGTADDTIIYAGKVEAHYSLSALMKKKVAISRLTITDARVSLFRDELSPKINIAEAFTGKEKAKNKKSPWVIKVGRGELQNVHFQMEDAKTGLHIKQDIKEIHLRSFILALRDHTIFLESIRLKEASGGVRLSPRLEPKIKKEFPWNFGLEKVKLSDLNFTFNHPHDSLMLNLVLEDGHIHARVLDLISKTINVDDISLKGLDAKIFTGQSVKTNKTSPGGASPDFAWDFLISKTDVEDANLFVGPYSLFSKTPASLTTRLTGLYMRLADIRIKHNEAGIVVKKLGFAANNGFILKKMKGMLESGSETTRLTFSLESENSEVQFTARASESLFGILENPKNVRGGLISFRNAQLSPKDALFFTNDLALSPLFNKFSEASLSVSGDLGLDKSSLELSGIEVTQGENFRITLAGGAENCFDLTKASGDLSLEIPVLNVDWLNELLRESGFDKDVSALTSISLQAKISDTLLSPVIALNLQSNLGNVALSGVINLTKEEYAISASFNKLMPGLLLNLPEAGTVSGKGSFTGTGFKQHSVIASFTLMVDSLHYDETLFRATSISGELDRGVYRIHALLDNPSLKTDMQLTLQNADSVLTLDANASVFVQLNDLHLSKDTISVESTIRARLIKTSNALSGEISLSEIEYSTPLDTAVIQNFITFFSADSIQTRLKGDADFFNADIRIKKPLDELSSLEESYRSYAATFIDPSLYNVGNRVAYLPEMKITGNITHHKILGLVLQDTGFHLTNLGFSLLNRSQDLGMRYTLQSSGLRYKMVTLENLTASVVDSAGIVNVQMLADSNFIYAKPANQLILNSRFENQLNSTEFKVIDKEGEFIYYIEISTKLDSNQLVLTIPKKQMILNQDIWQMDSPDLLFLNAKSKIRIPGFKMQKDASVVELYSSEGSGEQQLHCRLDNFTFNTFIHGDLIPAYPTGSISGHLIYASSEDSSKTFTTDLQLSNVNWSDLTIGTLDLNLTLSSYRPNDYAIDLSAKLDSSTIEIHGRKKAGEARRISSELKSFPINFFQPFIKEYLSELDGSISGNLSISPSGNEEDFTGEIKLEKVALKINPLNSSYRIPKETIVFADKKMIFNKFNVLDALNNRLIVDGYIDFSNDWYPMADMEVKSSNLQVMNTDGKDKAPFYGDIFIDSRLSMKGPFSKPVVNGNIVLTGGTQIFYRHLEDLSLSESTSLINFSDLPGGNDPANHSLADKQTHLFESSIETLVKIDPATSINFNLTRRGYSIDLGIKGGGTLNYQMLNNNQYALSGTYKISNGAAELKLVGWPNKSFQITQGGFIRWDGMIEDPDLKFEAISKVRSSYTNPVDGKPRDVDFNVILQLSNRVSDLKLVFTISTPDQYLMSIINTLSPEEQMRQAITILLFEIIDLPGISTSSDYVTQQVNQLVASQLNSLTKTTIKGVDISFGVDSYVQATQSGGEETKTSLSYEVRKSLMDDRAQIEVSGRLSDSNEEPGTSNMTLNNISFEYRLDSAATKYLKVYNEHTYEDVFEGEVIKTGVGVTYRKRYWNFGDIWKRKKERRK